MSEESVMTINLSKQQVEELDSALRFAIWRIVDALHGYFKVAVHPDRYEEKWFEAVARDMLKAKVLRRLLGDIERQQLTEKTAKEIQSEIEQDEDTAVAGS